MTQTFRIPASEGRISVIERIARVLHNLPSSLAWELSVTEYKPRRSDPQNRYLWGVVYPCILSSGQLQGWTKEDLHEYFLGEHFGWETITGFGKRRLRPLRRSSRMNKQEFADYVQFIQVTMANMGIYVPDPNEMTEAA